MKKEAAAAVSMIENIYKYGPLIIWGAATAILLIYKLDKEFPQITKDLEERESAEISEEKMFDRDKSPHIECAVVFYGFI